ncbi:transmembrane protein, putative [Bodo saltans]|uniref:Transmembrane protein, putative n=1 Tax=Bodo saltans TaxID=75058 RepID=A0A0S4IYX6_BODSA|nr:transmembrane protein, putative [Bodo saltans]|eukprot:CUG14449.1 transmembrane protein, putative [Bodo saltans]
MTNVTTTGVIFFPSFFIFHFGESTTGFFYWSFAHNSSSVIVAEFERSTKNARQLHEKKKHSGLTTHNVFPQLKSQHPAQTKREAKGVNKKLLVVALHTFRFTQSLLRKESKNTSKVSFLKALTQTPLYSSCSFIFPLRFIQRTLPSKILFIPP